MFEEMQRPRFKVASEAKARGFQFLSATGYPIVLYRDEPGRERPIHEHAADPWMKLTLREIQEIEETAESGEQLWEMVEGLREQPEGKRRVEDPKAMQVRRALEAKDAELAELRRESAEMRKAIASLQGQGKKKPGPKPKSRDDDDDESDLPADALKG